MIATSDLLTRVEQKQLWASFHKDWLLQIREQLRPQLPFEFGIFIESESVLISPGGTTSVATFSPDISVTRPESEMSPQRDGLERVSATVLEVREEIETFEQYSLQIRRVPENRVVAAAELISPTNKGTFGRLDREKYLRKREGYLDSGINLMEIDVLRVGERLLRAALEQLHRFDRTAWTVVHSDGSRHYRSWGWSESETLPRLEWEIEAGFSTVVDLELTCQRVCEFNPWETMVA